jgi:hypothetical protein
MNRNRLVVLGVALAVVVGGGIYAGTTNGPKTPLAVPQQARVEAPADTSSSEFSPSQLDAWRNLPAPERRSRVVRCRDAADRMACMLAVTP